MNRIIIILFAILTLSISILLFPNGLVAAMVGGTFVVAAIWLLRKTTDDYNFVTQVFLLGLLIRWSFASVTYGFDVWRFFVLDAEYYNELGKAFAQTWWAEGAVDLSTKQFLSNTTLSVWAMGIFVGAIYFVTEDNSLAAQFIISIFGAATAPTIYFCAKQLFCNQKVARISALTAALFPSLIVWSSLLMRDGIIIFFLILTMTIVLYLQERFSYWLLALLIASLFAIFVLRSYVFFMALVAVLGNFIIDTQNVKSLFRRVAFLVFIGLFLTYLGALRTAEQNLSAATNLERIQISRDAMAREAASGFGRDTNVSTIEGALLAIPVGLTYLILAPLPWQMDNLRQAITLPEMIVWWSSLPLFMVGVWYALNYRLKRSIGILLFILMLTLSYSVVQGNVGTAYRHRAQIQIFYFIFIAAGWTVLSEKQENRIFSSKRRQYLH